MVAVQLRRWTREEYERLVEIGVLRPDERVELIEGEIVEMTPQGTAHATAIASATRVLDAICGPEQHLRVQLPLALGSNSEPEPDLAVVGGRPRDYANAHPSTALLVLEIADASLAFDDEVKGSMYAKAGIPEYWIVNLVDRQLEVYREPAAVSGMRFGAGYRTRRIVLPGETVAPLAAPESQVAVADLLP